MYPEEEIVSHGAAGAGGPKPALLCLHGGGTNSTIFNIQMIRVRRVLDRHFDFVFLDAPLEGEPGPGVIPVFEGMEPYRRWHVKGDVVKPAETVALLRETMEAQRRKDGRGFVGAVGFSQGSKTVAGLLLEQQVREAREGGAGKGLAFGVMFNGTTPPLTAGLTDEEKMQRIAAPTLHIIGTTDPWRQEGLTMFGEHFDPRTATLMEFDVGHRLPILEPDTLKVTNKILQMYAETEGSGQMNLDAQ